MIGNGMIGRTMIGFEGMKFTARVSSEQDFAAWAQGVRSFSGVLDIGEYNGLLKPTKNNQTASYVSYDNSLYARAVMKYEGAHDHAMTAQHGDGQ